MVREEDNFTPAELQASMDARMPRHRLARSKPDCPSVYAITLVPRHYSSRTQLLMSSRKAALKFLRVNGHCLHECLYTFAVVERIPLDYTPRPFKTKEAYWFIWSYRRQDVDDTQYEAMSAVEKIRFLDDGCYCPIPVPSFCKNGELQASIG
jgi:hypothetical protein